MTPDVKEPMVRPSTVSNRTEADKDDKQARPPTQRGRNVTLENLTAYYGDNPTREQLDAEVVVAGPKNWIVLAPAVKLP